MKNNIKIGEVYLCDLGQLDNHCTNDHRQKGIRPCVVFSNNVGNVFSNNITVLPITSSKLKIDKSLPTHVFLPKMNSGLIKDSIVLCESPIVLNKARVIKRLTILSDYYMQQIAISSLKASSLLSFISKDILLDIWNECTSLNKT